MIISLTFSLDPPVIVKKPGNITVSIGASFTLDCTAWGDPRPQIQLLHNRPEDFTHVHFNPDDALKPGWFGLLLFDYLTKNMIVETIVCW